VKQFKIILPGKKQSQTTGADFVRMLPLKTMSLRTINDQGKDEGTIIFTAQLNLNMS
jgi:hypothetical protein